MADDFAQVIIDAREDAISLSNFMFFPAEELVERRLAPDINSLNYYLEYLDGLSKLYTQESGTVTVNGVEIKTVRQAMDDAIFESGKDGWTPVIRTVERGLDYVVEIYDWVGGTGDTPELGYVYSGGITDDISLAQNIRGIQGIQGLSGTIESVTATTSTAGSTASITLGGTPSSRTMAFTIPRGDKGEKGDTGDKGDTGSAAIISSASASTGAAGSNASVTLGGSSGDRTFAFTIPRGDKGEKGDAGELPNFYATTTLDTPNVNIASDGTFKRSNDPLNAASRKVGTAAGNLVERNANGYPTNNNALGVGQTWQDVSSSRVTGVNYTNTTGRPIVMCCFYPSNSGGTVDVFVDNLVVSSSTRSSGGTNLITTKEVSTIVPAGSVYRLENGFSTQTWVELR